VNIHRAALLSQQRTRVVCTELFRKDFLQLLFLDPVKVEAVENVIELVQIESFSGTC